MGVTMNGALDAGRGPHPAPYVPPQSGSPPQSRSPPQSGSPTSSRQLTCCIMQIPSSTDRGLSVTNEIITPCLTAGPPLPTPPHGVACRLILG